MRGFQNIGIRTRILLLLALIFVPLFAGQTGMYRRLLRGIYDQALARNQESARVAAGRFSDLIYSVLHQEGLLASAVFLGDGPTADSITPLLQSAVRGNPALLDLTWLRPDGAVVATSRREYEGRSFAGAMAVRRIQEGRSWYLDRTEAGGFPRARPLFTISRSIRREWNQLDGILMATVDPSVLESAIGWSKRPNEVLFVVDRRGYTVLFLPGANIPVSQRDMLADRESLLLKAGSATVSEEIELPELGGRYIVSLVPVSSTGWVAAAGVLEQAVLGPELQALQRRTLLYLLVTVVALGAALRLTLSILRPVNRLRDRALRLAQGDTETPVPVTGPPELQGLAQVLEYAREELRSSRKDLERKVAEQTVQLRGAMEMAEKASRAKGEFLAHMSHEIRTPVSAILGLSEVLEPRLEDPQQKRFLELIRESAQSLLSILGDILDLSRVESGKMAVQFQQFDPRELLERLVGTWTAGASRKNLTLEFLPEPILPAALCGDPNLIAQVVHNLLSNAVKYTERGGIQVRVSAREDTVRLESRDWVWFCVAVTDTGVGIPEDKQTRLFESFSRVHSQITRSSPEGTGLGLAISRRLVELMGGEIGVESRVGEGSTFWFKIRAEVLPVPGPRRSLGGAPLPGLGDLPGLKILLAEDNEVNRLFLQTALEDAGHRVSVAEDGRQAVDRVQSDPFDLVLMDIQLPVMDGMEAAQAIRRLPAPLSGIPIVAVTAFAVQGDEERFLQAGLDGYVSKPVDLTRLAGEILRARAARGGVS